ncbi:MAG: hypothetical protein NWP87_05145 [Winogradskyella sp.]|nr:hypothetical protein [Winogradskyella sp.]
MKRIFLALVVSCFTLAISGQSDRSIEQDEWYVSVGVNTINSLGSKNPLESPGDWAFKTPISASIETRWTDLFSLEIGLSLNGFDAGAPLDAAGPPAEDLIYFAVDTSLKYYFGEYILPRQEWFDLYIGAGLGLFVIEDANLSFNIGGGAIFWLNRNHTFGLKPQAVAKFAANHRDAGQIYPNNHFQYSIQAVFKL